MKYVKRLIIRLVLALLIRPWIFYAMFSFLTAYLPFIILRLFGINAVYEQSVNSLYIGTNSFLFVSACVASSAYYLLSLLVLTTKDISFKKSIKMLFFGYLAILLFNVLRIIVLIWVSIYLGQDYFNKLHMAFWYIVSTLFVVFLWIVLIKTYNVKNIPVYSDLVTLIGMIKRAKKKKNKNKK